MSYSSASRCYIDFFNTLCHTVLLSFFLSVHSVFFTWSIKHVNFVVPICYKVPMYSCSDVMIEMNFLTLHVLHGALYHNLENVYI